MPNKTKPDRYGSKPQAGMADITSRSGGNYLWEFLFFLSFAIVLVKSVQIKVLISGWLLGFLSSSFGLFASYKWDLSTAPLIVASLSILYFLMLLVKVISKDN
jgi:ABC-type Mn2+/Zn2+ transport system permease subunit